MGGPTARAALTRVSAAARVQQQRTAMLRCRAPRATPPAAFLRAQRLRSVPARSRSTEQRIQIPAPLKLTSKFGRSETLPQGLQEHGFALWSSFLDPKEQDKFVNGLLNSKLRGETVDASMGTFKRYRQPFEELLEVMEKIDDSGLLRGVRRSDENLGAFWVDDIEPTDRVEPTFELPGTGDRVFVVNFFSPVVVSLFREESSDIVSRFLIEPGALLSLTGPAKALWLRLHESQGMWDGKRLPPRRRFEMKLIPTFDQQWMQRMVDSAEKDLGGATPGNTTQS